MATARQIKAIRKVSENIRNNKPVNLGEIMLDAGYSKSMAKRPKSLTNSITWQELLKKYDDQPIMDAIYKDALSDKDSRNATANRTLYLKVKDRFPAQKLKLDQYQEELNQF